MLLVMTSIVRSMWAVHWLEVEGLFETAKVIAFVQVIIAAVIAAGYLIMDAFTETPLFEDRKQGGRQLAQFSRDRQEANNWRANLEVVIQEHLREIRGEMGIVREEKPPTPPNGPTGGGPGGGKPITRPEPAHTQSQIPAGHRPQESITATPQSFDRELERAEHRDEVPREFRDDLNTDPEIHLDPIALPSDVAPTGERHHIELPQPDARRTREVRTPEGTVISIPLNRDPRAMTSLPAQAKEETSSTGTTDESERPATPHEQRTQHSQSQNPPGTRRRPRSLRARRAA